MAIATTKYVRNPLYVDAIKVTKDNFLEIAFWCKGSIKNIDESEVREGAQIDPEAQYIQLQKVNNPKNQRQTQAHIGDWILRTDKGFKIYNDQAFKNSFSKLQGEAADAANQAAKPQPTNQEDTPMDEEQQAQNTEQDQQGTQQNELDNPQTPGENAGQVETEQVREPVEPPAQEQTSADSNLATPQPDAPVEAEPEVDAPQTPEARGQAEQEQDATPGDAPPVQ